MKISRELVTFVTLLAFAAASFEQEMLESEDSAEMLDSEERSELLESKNWSEIYGVGYEPDDKDDPHAIPPGYLDVNGGELDVSKIRGRKTLFVNNGGKWGDWGDASFCPTGSYAAGYNVKIESNQGAGDDTGLNGIKIYCHNKAGDLEGVCSSSVGGWGTWRGIALCHGYDAYLSSFQLQVEPKQGRWKDDTAANYVRFKCRGLNSPDRKAYLISAPPYHGTWGSYGAWSSICDEGTAICGIKTRVERNQHLLDDTALNDVMFYCCE